MNITTDDPGVSLNPHWSIIVVDDDDSKYAGIMVTVGGTV